jgi:uncharacterized protein YjiS (DUF1127 family)
MALITHGEFADVGSSERSVGLAARLQSLLKTWQQRAHERLELSRMNERELHDMGISRVDALVEYTKPFWQK